MGSHGIHHVYNLGNPSFNPTGPSLIMGSFISTNGWSRISPGPLAESDRRCASSFLLFPVCATRTTHEGRVKGIWQQCRPEEFEPSEACNSRELLPQFLKYFKPIKMYLHGGLMYPIFEGTAPNIDETKLINKLRIRIVYHAETLLTKLRLSSRCS